MYNWIEAGCPRERLHIGIPGYGRAFSADGRDPFKAFGQGGGGSGSVSSPYLGESGLLAYFEVRLSSGFPSNSFIQNLDLSKRIQRRLQTLLAQRSSNSDKFQRWLMDWI